MKNTGFKKGEIIVYKTQKSPEIKVRLEEESIWLYAHLIARLFEVKRPAIVLTSPQKTVPVESC